VSTKSQLGWINLPHVPILLLPVIAKHWVVKFQEVSLRRDIWLWRERFQYGHKVS